MNNTTTGHNGRDLCTGCGYPKSELVWCLCHTGNKEEKQSCDVCYYSPNTSPTDDMATKEEWEGQFNILLNKYSTLIVGESTIQDSLSARLALRDFIRSTVAKEVDKAVQEKDEAYTDLRRCFVALVKQLGEVSVSAETLESVNLGEEVVQFGEDRVNNTMIFRFKKGN